MILGIGIDLCEVGRIRRLLEKDRERFVRRVFGEGERDYCDARRRPAIHYAARFAAKEAFLKAVGTGWRLGWRQVEVVRGPSGRPELSLCGPAAELAARRGIGRIHVSLTHTAETAAAVVVLEGDPTADRGGGTP
jgi:holo-[acyl-carrier protein] synthase